jgi:hypothetical protein
MVGKLSKRWIAAFASILFGVGAEDGRGRSAMIG